MKADANDLSQTLDEKSEGEMSEAEIDDNLKDSFPASDPPSWTLGSEHHPASGQGAEDVDGMEKQGNDG